MLGKHSATNYSALPKTITFECFCFHYVLGREKTEERREERGKEKRRGGEIRSLVDFSKSPLM